MTSPYDKAAGASDPFALLEKWTYNTDQPSSCLPTWFDAVACEKRARKALAEIAPLRIFDGGAHTIGKGIVYVRNAVITATGEAHIRAYGAGTVICKDKARVTASDTVKVELYDESHAELYDRATCIAHDRSDVWCYGFSHAKLLGDSSGVVAGNASATATGNSSLTIAGQGTGWLYGNATLAWATGSSVARVLSKSVTVLRCRDKAVVIVQSDMTTAIEGSAAVVAQHENAGYVNTYTAKAGQTAVSVTPPAKKTVCKKGCKAKAQKKV